VKWYLTSAAFDHRIKHLPAVISGTTFPNIHMGILIVDQFRTHSDYSSKTEERRSSRRLEERHVDFNKRCATLLSDKILKISLLKTFIN
jgi:hypothetical protein